MVTHNLIINPIVDTTKAAVTAVREWLSMTKRVIRIRHFLLCNRLLKLRDRVKLWISRHRALVLLTCVLLAVLVTGAWLAELQTALGDFFTTDERLHGLRSLFLTIGSALIGAGVITLTLVLFAMQVNIERMPHVLFRKFSADAKLLCMFAAALLIAIAISVLSLMPDESWLSLFVFAAGWGVILNLILFFLAYRRAISLINPAQQLQFIIDGTKRDLNRWAHRAQRANSFIEELVDEEPKIPSTLMSTHDTTRFIYFRHNPHWSDEARRAVSHANSYALLYAKRGDHELSNAALLAVIEINRAYVIAKGKTFFSEDLLPNRLTTDGFINETLEHLKRTMSAALSQRDERQIEQSLNAIVSLVSVYLSIDYSTRGASKFHAHLAAGYLSSAADSILPQDMPDVLMEWMSCLEKTQLLILQVESNTAPMLAKKVAMIAAACLSTETHRPVTLKGIEHLANLTHFQLRTKSAFPIYPLGELWKNVESVALVVLSLPDDRIFSIQGGCLGPYYSLLPEGSFLRKLITLRNQVVDAPDNDEAAQTVIYNIRHWADGVQSSQKKLLCLSIKNGSLFTNDLIRWISHVVKILLDLSNADACDDRTGRQLRNAAKHLTFVLDWVPDDEDSVKHVAQFKLTDVLFEIALHAHNVSHAEFSIEIDRILVSWAFKGGRYQTGWGVLQHSIFALSTLAMVRGGGVHCQELMDKLADRIGRESNIDQDLLNQAASAIRQKATTPWVACSTDSSIETEMRCTDRELLSKLLDQIACLLSPDT